jgi:hypothetical protein
MKTKRLTLVRIRNIKAREREHRHRRKTLTFGALYGMGSRIFNYPYGMRGKGIQLDDIHSVDFLAASPKDLHSFQCTRIRTGRIRKIPSVRTCS